jgi:hypothetical protein
VSGVPPVGKPAFRVFRSVRLHEFYTSGLWVAVAGGRSASSPDARSPYST